jgi:CRP-like cAMP-binding protein
LISPKDWKRILKNALFGGCDPARLADICAAGGCEVREFAAGEVVLSPKTDRRAACLLLSGRASVQTPDPGRATLLRYLSENEPFGIANLFGNRPFVSLIRAESRCRVFFLTETSARRLLEEDHAFLYAYLDFLSGRIHYLNQKIGYLTAGSAERRLALYLSAMNADEITLPVSLSDLSELLDVGRASLYRAFDRLTADGFLQKDGRTIRLLNRVAMLRAYQ